MVKHLMVVLFLNKSKEKKMNMNFKIGLLISIFFISTFYLKSHDCFCGAMSELLEEYSKADGIDVEDKSWKLAKMLVSDDACFFEGMYDSLKLFHRWTNDIQYTVFTESADDSLDIELNKVYFLKLKEIMIIKTKKYLTHKKYNKIATELYNKLNAITILTID
jgi:hypothetical protein